MRDAVTYHCGKKWGLLYVACLSILCRIPFDAFASAQANPETKTTLRSSFKDRADQSWQLEAFAAGGFVPSYTTEIPRDPYAGVHFQIQPQFPERWLRSGPDGDCSAWSEHFPRSWRSRTRNTPFLAGGLSEASPNSRLYQQPSTVPPIRFRRSGDMVFLPLQSCTAGTLSRMS